MNATSSLPFFRIRPGESAADYVRRMRDGYGKDWFLLPICLASNCSRKPVVSFGYGGRVLYYCAAHKRRIGDPDHWGNAKLHAVPFVCPSRRPFQVPAATDADFGPSYKQRFPLS